VLIAILFAIIAPLLAQLLYLACSRRREYLADASAARFTRYPEGLASALQKISASAERMAKVNRAVAPMFTVNPLKGSAARSLFSTHPPTDDRVRILRSMAGGAGYAEYEAAYAQAQGQHLLGRHTLAEADQAEIRAPSAEPEKEDLAKARDAVDILHRMGGFLFLACVCGLKIKVPPQFKGDEVHCPRCERAIPIPAPALAAAGAGAILDTVAEADRQEAAGAEVRREEQAPTYRFKPGQWQSFRCPCGKTVQLSPTFSAKMASCRSCGRHFNIEHP
jgi:heat shock protein HtpX